MASSSNTVTSTTNDSVSSNTSDQFCYPTTESQREVWLASQQSVAGNCAYNEISSLAISGDLDVELLKLATEKVVERNESLRTTFSRDGLKATVHNDVRFSYRYEDLTELAGDCKSQSNAEAAIIDQEGSVPFDLIDGPLLRVVVQKLNRRKYKYTFTAHHIVLDGWSLALYCRDLGHFYDALSGAETDPLPAAQNYSEYERSMSEYLESEQGKSDEAFWLDLFSDSVPILDLPTDNSRPSLRTFHGSRYDHVFPAGLIDQVRKIGAKSGSSLFNVMLATFSAYISRISGSDDFCLAIPSAGQSSMDRPELMGHCVNVLPYRTQVDIEQTFGDYLKQSRTALLDAFDHQRFTSGILLRKLKIPRDPSRPALQNVSFNVDPIIDLSETGFRGMNVHVQVEPRGFENFDWFVNGIINEDKSIDMQVQYNSDIFCDESLESYFSGYEAFLEGLVKTPAAQIKNLPIISVPQRQKSIVQWNETELEYPLDSTLSSEFTRQAQETPDKVAVKFGDKSLTYDEVEKRSNQVARYLISEGIQAGDLVGICVQRSEQMLVNLFAIMKAGAGYVPLDPAYPSDRLLYMCDHSGLKMVVTQEELVEQVSEFNKPMIAIDSAQEKIEKLDDEAIQQRANPNDICYVIYTSGSTGKPKGVQVPHGAVVNFLYSMQQTPGFTSDDSVLAVTTLSFDIAVLELYLPTISGGTVVILDSHEAADGTKLAEQLNIHNISLLQATPATWRLMIQAGWSGKRDLKVLCGGEPMPNDLVRPLLERCSELWNMYGPTETTVWSAAYRITDENAPILIGKPIGNTQIYILDNNGSEVAVGCEGEVYIGGAGVTLGYRNRQDLTDERFVENRYRNPFTNYVSDRLYKTGDLAKYRMDGNIQFLRRNDKQVKVRGFRIELGEIEQSLKRHDGIEHNVVIVREDNAGDARLVAYYIAKDGEDISPSQLKSHLNGTLPYYMIPQHFVKLSEMPQTNNGKIDYKALPAPNSEVESSTESADIAMPESESEKYLASVWQDVLEMDDIGLDDTFFDIGGHSLLVMKVINTVLDQRKVKLSPQDFLMCTLEQLAAKLDGTENAVEEVKTITNSIEELRSDIQANVRVQDKVSDRNASSKMAQETNSKPETKQGIIKKLKGFWD